MKLRVVTRDRRPLLYSSQYGSEKSPTYVEFVDVFKKDIAKTFGGERKIPALSKSGHVFRRLKASFGRLIPGFSGTTYAPRYVTTEMNYITHPKTVNSEWPDGLLVE